MLHILLMIVKVVGIVIAAILGLMITALCIVLLVPLRYRISGELKGELKSSNLEMRFSWLLRIFSGEIAYKEDNLEYNIRFLWKKLASSEDARCEEESKKITKEADIPKNSKAVPKTFEQPGNSVKARKASQNTEATENEESQKEEQQESKQLGKLEEIKCTIQKVYDKIKRVYAFLKKEAHQHAFSKLKEEFLRLLFRLKPKKVNGIIRFGMDDPYQTGQILAVLSVLYPLYAEHVEIYPDFEKKVLEGNIFIKGHIRIVHFCMMAIRIILDRNVRTTIRDMKEIL